MTLTEEQKLGIQARIDEYIKRYERPTYLDGILPSKSRNYYGASHYDKELDLLEVCWVWWPNGPRRPKSNPKKWKYESNWYGWRQKRFFVDRDTKTIWRALQQWGSCKHCYTDTEIICCSNLPFDYWIVADELVCEQFNDELSKMFDSKPVLAAPSNVFWAQRRWIPDFYSFKEWFKQQEIKAACPETGKRYKQVMSWIDNVKKAPACALNWPKEYADKIYSSAAPGHNFWYYDDTTDVWRMFASLWDNQVQETHRVIFKNGKMYFYVNSPSTKNKWVYARSSVPRNTQEVNILMLNIEKSKLYDAIKNCSAAPSFGTVAKVYTSPDLEQLGKMEMKTLSNHCYLRPVTEVLGHPCNKKATSVIKRYGMSKEQLESFDAFLKEEDDKRGRWYYRCYNYGWVLEKLRVFNNSETLFNLGPDIEDLARGITSMLNTVSFYGADTALRMRYLLSFPKEQTLQILKRAGKITKEEGGATLVSDTFSMALNSKTALETERYRWQIRRRATSLDDCLCDPKDFVFKNRDELQRLHNRLDATIRLAENTVAEREAEIERRQNEELQKQYEKTKKARLKMEKMGENFLIKLPQTGNDIIDEGSALHHCVGSYVQGHIRGTTTILFLRKAEQPDTPFYTIEVSGGRIIQIHGFGNKWIGNDPEAAKFAYKWAKEQEFIFSKETFLCKSFGYSRTSDMLPESILED